MFNHINLKKISGYFLSKKHGMHHLNYNEFNHDHIHASKFKSNAVSEYSYDSLAQDELLKYKLCGLYFLSSSLIGHSIGSLK